MVTEISKSAIVVSEARSGTNALLSTVKSMWPDAIILREIFKKPGASHELIEKHLGINKDTYAKLRSENPASLWTALCDYSEARETPLIAKIFYSHVPKSDPVWDTFKDRSNVILLIRQNPFKQYVSLQLATQSGQWILRPGKENLQENVTLSIDPEELKNYIQRKRQNIRWAREFYEYCKPMVVFYEDFTQANDDYWNIFEPFGALPKTGRARLNTTKQTTRPMREIVTNYSDVQDYDVESDF